MVELRGGATPPDEPEARARRDEARQVEAARDAYAHTVRFGIHPPGGPAAAGMRVAHHPHDAPPNAGHVEPVPDDLTGRHHYQASTSPMVCQVVHCTHPGCDAYGTWYGRADTLDRITAAGGPRCANHPLDAHPLDQPA